MPFFERAAFVRFRRAVVARGLDQSLFEAVAAQLRRRRITVETGTLVETFAITPANVNDRRAGPDALPDNSDAGEVLADSAYRGSHIAR